MYGAVILLHLEKLRHGGTLDGESSVAPFSADGQ